MSVGYSSRHTDTGSLLSSLLESGDGDGGVGLRLRGAEGPASEDSCYRQEELNSNDIKLFKSVHADNVVLS